MLEILRPYLMKLVTSVLRTLLASGTAWLMSRKYINEDIATQLTVFIMAVVPIFAWSFIEKYLIEKLHLDRLLAALRLPENSTLADLKRATAVTKELPDVDTSYR